MALSFSFGAYSVDILVELGVPLAPDDTFKPLPRNDLLASPSETCLQ